MPAQRPSASFDPISPNLDLDALVDNTPNFEYVVRISCEMLEHQGLEAFEKLVLLHVIIGGKPLVIEGFQHRLDQWTFSDQWLQDNHGTKFEQARNLVKQQNIALSISHYLNNMARLTNQWNEHNYKQLDRQRIYLKDIDCPEVWHEKLKEQIPPCVFYLNESTGEFGGHESVDEPSSTGPGIKKGLGVARAGDLMSCLPPAMRADNMMCYIGHEGTYTPAHREMCASLGQNIMVEASGTVDQYGKPTKPGSSIWFMTETKDRHLVSEYWLSTLGHDIEIEAHFAQINAWKAAPFKTYVVEQKVGDFILIPPLAPHQVWNRGTRTMKVAWNRTTVETLEMALNEALPRARMVCRDEQYKNKAMVMFALEKYSRLLKQVDTQKKITINQQAQLNLTHSPKIRQLQKDFKRLFALYTQILISEMLAPVSPTERRGQYLPYDSYVTCSYCRCNIFNRFLTCTSCIILLANGDEDTYDICMECYVMGRSCKCISRYRWVEQFPWQDLVQKHDMWRHQIINFDGKLTAKSPQPLHVERANMNKKTLAQVCQEQLKARPWCDPSKEGRGLQEAKMQESEEEPKINGDGTRQRKRKKRPSERILRETLQCHISQHREPRWKVAACQCGRGYAYGSLFRAFDMMPLHVMENPDWKCPYCLKICSCAACRKLPDMQPFEPKGTILGHDTRKVADARSVESLVDFSYSNIAWIKKAGDDHPLETRRLRRRRDEADQDKSANPDLDHYVDVEEHPLAASENQDTGIKYDMDIDFPIDPMLMTQMPAVPQTIQANDNNLTKAPATHESHKSSKRSKPPAEPTSHDSCNSNSADGGTLCLNSGNMQSQRFAAPVAAMVNHGSQVGMYIAQEINGIIYQYPDSASPEQNHSHQPVDLARNGEAQNNHKPSLPDTLNIIQSDKAPSPRNDANTQYHQAQIHRTLVEAKRNDRLISAEAAFLGKSLRIRFRVDSAKLAMITHENSKALQGPCELARDGVAIEDTGPVLVQSDFLTTFQPQPIIGRPTGSTKKRKAKDTNDDDFSTRKKPTRKSTMARPDSSNETPNSSTNNHQDSGESDDDSSSDQKQIAVEKQREPRKLSAYLTRRSDDVAVESSSDPYDALTKHRRRQKSSSGHINAENSRKLESRFSNVQSREEQSPVDHYPAQPLSEPDASVDLSTLGPGETTRPTNAAFQQAEKNRKAKLRALRWAEAQDDVSD